MLQILSNPWELRTVIEKGALRKEAHESSSFIDGSSLVCLGDVAAICSVSGKKLNRKRLALEQGEYSLFELPGPAIEGDASGHEKIHVQDQHARILNSFDLSYPPRRSSNLDTPFDAFFNAAYFLRRNVLETDRTTPPRVCWRKVIKKLCAHNDKDPARQASIVDLAHELPLHLEKVTKQPRRTLKRVRDQERIQRVREMDKACLIALSRRPGLAIAEKAGPRQRILAVRREETNNTLENRVVRHCCSLIRRASNQYLSLHKDIDITLSPRKESVDDFKRKAIKWNACEELRGVSILATPCKSPNYVLLENPHYSRIWKAYVALVKNEELRANVWRWQRQLWKEIATVGISELFTHWVEQLDASIKVPVAEERIVGGARNFSQGSFINPDVLPGPYILGRSVDNAGTLYLVDQEGMARLYPQTNILLMNADFYLVWAGIAQRKVVPIYCRFSSEDASDPDCQSEAKDALSHLAAFYPELGGAILLRSNLNGNRAQVFSDPETGNQAWNIWLSIDPKDWPKKEELKMNNPVESLIR